MKKRVLILVATFSVNMILAQDLIIELGIVWKKDTLCFNKDFIKPPHSLTPYLKITYRNASDKAIYFRNNFGDEKNVFYKMGMSILPISNFSEFNISNFLKRIERARLCLQEGYIVEINNEHLKTVHPNLYIYDKEGEIMDIGVGIESDLYDLTQLLHMQEQLNKYFPKKQIPLFNYSGKSVISLEKAYKSLRKIGLGSIYFEASDTNFSRLKDYFIFLKKGEVHEQELNLFPFLLVGGKYHFKFHALKMDDFVHTGIKDKLAIPKELEGYSLYDKAFISNEVYIDFSIIH